MRLISHPLAIAAIQAMAAWPVWPWYYRRLTDGSDGPWPLAALVVVAGLLAAAKPPKEEDPASTGLGPASALMALYAASVVLLPPIFRCAAALVAVGYPLARWRMGRGWHWPVKALLVLGAPMIASLDFTLGFPLRFVAAHATAGLLSLAGFAVSPEGTLLRWGSKLVEIDSPCSGARMLYAGLFVTAALAAHERFGLRRTAAAFAVAVPAIVAANVFRAAGLFFVEAGVVAAPGWTHSGLGILVFGLLAISLLHANRWIGVPHSLPVHLLPAALRTRNG